MTGTSVLWYDKNALRRRLHKWFGTNRGTHWTVAGSVVVIIFSTYLIYNSRDGNPATTIAAAGRAPAPMTPGPLILKR
jgi:hypothetical protein